MKHNRFSVEQIISILKEYEAGARMADLSRKHGVSEQSLYRWRSKYGRMSVSGGEALEGVGEGERQVEALAERGEIRQKSAEGIVVKRLVTPGTRREQGLQVCRQRCKKLSRPRMVRPALDAANQRGRIGYNAPRSDGDVPSRKNTGI